MSNSIITFTGTPNSGMSVLIQCLKMLELQTLDNNYGNDAYSINRLLFQDLEHSPIMAGPFVHNWMDTQGAVQARDRIGNLLSNHTKVPGPLFLADPFMCRFMPLWIEKFNNAGIETKFVFLVRHPWETAQSLALDLNIDLANAHLLWLIHIRDMMRYCRNFAIIAFDQFLADPVSTLVRLGKEMDLSWPKDPMSVRSSILKFVQPGKKHCDILNVSERDKKAFRAYDRLYQEIRIKQLSGFHESNALELHPLREKNVTSSKHCPLAFARYIPNNGSDMMENLLGVIGQYEKQVAIWESKLKNISAKQDDTPFFQIIFPSTNKQEGVIEKVPLILDEWQKISLPVPEGCLLKDKPIVFKPMNTYGTMIIRAISVIDRSTGDRVWIAKTKKDFDQLIIEGTVVRLPDRDRLSLLATGKNLSVIFTLPEALTDSPIELSVWLKAEFHQASISSVIGTDNSNKAEPIAQDISRKYCQKIKIINNTGHFHHQFKVRKNEFEKLSSQLVEGELINAKTFWGRDIKLIPTEVVSNTIYSFGLLEPNLVAFCIDFLTTGLTVLDVGAHIGFFSMLCAELVGEKGKVVSFEPTPSTANILKINTKEFRQVMVVPKLAWHKKGRVELQELGMEFSAYNTAVADRLRPKQKTRAEDKRIMVEAVTLDEFANDKRIQPDFIKLDVESAEMNVLKGMINMLDKRRPIVTIEVGDIIAENQQEVPLSRDLIEFVMEYDYLPIESVGSRYQEHKLRQDKYTYDNIIMVPVEKLPTRRPIGNVAVNNGKIF